MVYMKIVRTWLVVSLVSVGILYLGISDNSELFKFLGSIGIGAGMTCEVSIIIVELVEKFIK